MKLKLIVLVVLLSCLWLFAGWPYMLAVLGCAGILFLVDYVCQCVGANRWLRFDEYSFLGVF